MKKFVIKSFGFEKEFFAKTKEKAALAYINLFLDIIPRNFYIVDTEQQKIFYVALDDTLKFSFEEFAVVSI